MNHPWIASARPFVRWWWFNQPLDLDVIRRQLDGIVRDGFGGVEIAWVYPHQSAKVLGPKWLGPKWSEIVAATKRECDARGLGCDLTFGSLWPFCGSFLTDPDSAQEFDGPMYRMVRHSWEVDEVPILNHLSERSLRVYAERMLPAFRPALEGTTSALFCDSWEISARRLWSPELWEEFEKRLGYDLRPFSAENLEDFPEVRQDYLAFLGRIIVERFYRPFTAICREAGAVSRVQCHGSPTDLLEAYASVDIPESEAILFEPSFSRIAASAAVLSGKRLVSCEAFTCPYGFPAREMFRERGSDLRLLADAVFARGVNRLVWHGLAYHDPERPRPSDCFFATTHLGPGGALAPEIPGLNAYFTAVSERMSRGRTLTALAVYLPIEDGRMKGSIPYELRTPAAHSYWELRDAEPPAETLGHHPIWISEHALRLGDVRGGRLYVGDAIFSAIYVDVERMSLGSLREIVRLARAGLPVVLKREPTEPGRITSEAYRNEWLPALKRCPNVTVRLDAAVPEPFLSGERIPPYWARLEGDTIHLFLAHPDAAAVRYPMRLGQAEESKPDRLKLELRHGPIRARIDARFEAGRSLLFEIDRKGVREISLPGAPARPSGIGDRLADLFRGRGKPG